MALSDGCVCYFKLDTNGTVTDATGNGNNGTIYGATYDASGHINGCYSFDGTNDYINVPDSASFDITSAISVACWYNSDGNQRVLIAKRSSTEYSWELAIESDGDIRFRINANSNEALTTLAPGNGTWQHAVGTYDGSTIRVYIDGVERKTASYSTAISDTSVDVAVGRRNYIGAEGEFDGHMDEVGIWNRALSAAEVTSLYNGGTGIQYPFSGGGGDYANEVLGVTISEINGIAAANVNEVNGL